MRLLAVLVSECCMQASRAGEGASSVSSEEQPAGACSSTCIWTPTLTPGEYSEQPLSSHCLCLSPLSSCCSSRRVVFLMHTVLLLGAWAVRPFCSLPTKRGDPLPFSVGLVDPLVSLARTQITPKVGCLSCAASAIALYPCLSLAPPRQRTQSKSKKDAAAV